VRAVPLALLALAAVLGGCSDSGLSPAAERGRLVYLAQCTACHSTDPAKPGPIGPPIRGSSRALLEAKVLNGIYPPGYTPKRPTRVMGPMPQVASDLPALADYLQ